jgi:hypothetical protein
LSGFFPPVLVVLIAPNVSIAPNVPIVLIVLIVLIFIQFIHLTAFMAGNQSICYPASIA